MSSKAAIVGDHRGWVLGRLSLPGSSGQRVAHLGVAKFYPRTTNVAIVGRTRNCLIASLLDCDTGLAGAHTRLYGLRRTSSDMCW